MLTHSLDLYAPAAKAKLAQDPAIRGEPRSSTSTVTTCKPGEVRLLGSTRTTQTDGAGNKDETVELLFVLADIQPPTTVRVGAAPTPIDSELRAPSKGSPAAVRAGIEKAPRSRQR